MIIYVLNIHSTFWTFTDYLRLFANYICNGFASPKWWNHYWRSRRRRNRQSRWHDAESAAPETEAFAFFGIELFCNCRWLIKVTNKIEVQNKIFLKLLIRIFEEVRASFFPPLRRFAILMPNLFSFFFAKTCEGWHLNVLKISKRDFFRVCIRSGGRLAGNMRQMFNSGCSWSSNEQVRDD